MTDHDFMPCFSVKPNSVTLYDQPLFDIRYNRTGFAYAYQDKSFLKHKQAKRLRELFSWLYSLSKKKRVYSKERSSYYNFKINFITLTLPSKQRHTDKEILKNCLEPFLRKIRNAYEGVLYIWKAETQDNGNLHFHLNTNVFIHYMDLRMKWNQSLIKLGYVDKNNPLRFNSTDIRAVQNAQQLAGYMAKYMTKGDLYKTPLKRYHRRFAKVAKFAKFKFDLPGNYFSNLKRKITCKQYDASNILKGIKINQGGYNVEIGNEIDSLMTSNKVLHGDYFICILTESLESIQTPLLRKFINAKLQKVLDHSKKAPIQYEIKNVGIPSEDSKQIKTTTKCSPKTTILEITWL